MQYRITMRNTITDPIERTHRLRMLYELFTKKAPTDDSLAADPVEAESAESNLTRRDDCITANGGSQNEEAA